MTTYWLFLVYTKVQHTQQNVSMIGKMIFSMEFHPLQLMIFSSLTILLAFENLLHPFLIILFFHLLEISEFMVVKITFCLRIFLTHQRIPGIGNLYKYLLNEFYD